MSPVGFKPTISAGERRQTYALDRADTWTGLIIPLGGEIGPWVLGTLNCEVVQVRNRGKIGLNRSLIYVHPFPPLSLRSFYLRLFNSVAKRKLFLGRKNIGRGGNCPRPSSSPPPSDASAVPCIFMKFKNCLERILW